LCACSLRVESKVVSREAPIPKATAAETRANSSARANIQAIIDGGRQIIVGTIAPIRGAAVA
jgi:hypothetical protein